MKKVNGQTYLYQHKGYYYFRVSIPKRMVSYFPHLEYKKALKTKDFKRARSKCWRMSNAALSFFEEISEILMKLTEDKIKEIVRNHFEKRLLDASEELIYQTRTVRDDYLNGFCPSTIGHMKKESTERLAHYNVLKASHDYDQEQIRIASEILDYEGIDIEENRLDFPQLCLEMVRAHYEAARINKAHLHANHKNSQIDDPYFKGCVNFFETPNPELFFEYKEKPYYKENSSIKITDAYKKYSQFKIDEAKHDDKSLNSLKEHNGFFNRLFDMWGHDKNIENTTKANCNELKQFLVKFPFKYDINFGKNDISLLSVLNGGQMLLNRIPSAIGYFLFGCVAWFFRLYTVLSGNSITVIILGMALCILPNIIAAYFAANAHRYGYTYAHETEHLKSDVQD